MEHLGFWIGVAGVGIAYCSGFQQIVGLTIILLAINGFFAYG